MTLLEYALTLVDEKLATLRVIEGRLHTLERLAVGPTLQADIRALAADYAGMRDRALQQKQALLDEVARYHAERAWHTSQPSVLH